jgi:hypothetical protein
MKQYVFCGFHIFNVLVATQPVDAERLSHFLCAASGGILPASLDQLRT